VVSLSNRDSAIGRVVTPAVKVKTGEGMVVLPTKSVVSVVRGRGKRTQVTVLAWGSKKHVGEWADATLEVAIGTGTATLRTEAILSLKRPKASAPPDLTAKFERLLHQLGSDSFAERKAATAALVEMGALIRPMLAKHQNSRDPEVRMRVREILGKLKKK
jgi:hypothetical protein